MINDEINNKIYSTRLTEVRNANYTNIHQYEIEYLDEHKFNNINIILIITAAIY